MYRHNDINCVKIIEYFKLGWTNYLSSVDYIMKPYWEVRSDIEMVGYIIVRNNPNY